MRSIALKLLHTIKLPAAGNVLDAGCGSGQTMEWLAGILPGWQCTGVDLSHDALTAARSIGQTVGAASVLDLPLESHTFDLTISLDVLQHLPLDGGDAKALREIHRVLKPRGVLLIRTNAQSFPRVRADEANLYQRYDPEPLARMLTECGFDILRLSRANSILGLAEIPRELRAKGKSNGSYHGLLSTPRAAGRLDRIKRRLLEAEGTLLARGARLPFGRTLFALCRRAS